MRTRPIVAAIAFLLLFGLSLWVATAKRPGPEDGIGQLYGHLWCMGVKFDSGEAYPVDHWPAGLHVLSQPIDLPAVLVDDAGNVRFREGDRVYVIATLYHADSGDTACSNLNSLTVDSVTHVSPPSTQPSAR